MSKNKEEKSATQEQPPLDYQTEVKMLSYTLTLRDIEINELKKRVTDMSNSISNLEKERADLKAGYVQSFKTEKTIRQMQDTLETSEKEIERLSHELKIKERQLVDEVEQVRKNYEGDITKLKQTIESLQNKMENVNNLQNLTEKQEDQIKHLEAEKDKMRVELEEKLRNKEIRNQIKFTDLKKKMMDEIQETQKNVTQLNIEYMDVSTKLTLLQNHQLLIELEYQSQQIEELLKKKESLT